MNNFQNKKGVKKGCTRGKYVNAIDAKKRVLAAFKDGDWKAVARANAVPVQTAYGWINKGDVPRKARGGRKFVKVEATHIDSMLQWVGENPLVTLKEIKNKLTNECNLNVSTTCIHKHLDGQMFTLKNVSVEPVTMNSAENKLKRAAFVQSLMTAIGANKNIIYIDESNCNLFLRRSNGRSKKGTRCCVKAASSKGPNIHIIAAICQTGIVYWEKRRGSYKKEDCADWFRAMLRTVSYDFDSIVIVCDNAPVHAGLETVISEYEFIGATILRTAPYSAPLNPIEECWSVMKAAMKRKMASSFNEMMAPPASGMTLKEHRLRYLEATVDDAMLTITPMLCLRTCNHVQRHFPGCLAKEDLIMGDNVKRLVCE